MRNTPHTPKTQARQAVLADLPALETMERQIWEPLGLEYYTARHMRSWLETFPQGFLVAADQDNKAIGLACVQVCNLDLSQGPLFPWSHDTLTDHGHIRSTHNPNGNCLLGITLDSERFGARRRLMEALFDLSTSLHKPLVGVSRLPGLAAFFSECKKAQTQTDQAAHFLALHYARESAKMITGRVALSGQDLSLWPAPKRADPVLAAYLRLPDTELVGVAPKFLADPQSLNAGAVFVRKHKN